MKLIIYNGSPRNKKSNSKILIDKFLHGFNKAGNNSSEVLFLANNKTKKKALETFTEAKYILIIFPLYTDAMPGLVKEFFEQIYFQLPKHHKKIGFIVQSGFPEAKHSIYVEKYLKKFVENRLKAEYLGTVIKGGVEGIQVMPERMTKKLFSKFEELGQHFAEEQEFKTQIIEELKKPYQLSKFRLLLFNFFKIFGITNLYWNMQLKKNNAYNNRFAKPLVD